MAKRAAPKSIKKPVKSIKQKNPPALPSKDSDGGAMGELMPKVKKK